MQEILALKIRDAQRTIHGYRTASIPFSESPADKVINQPSKQRR